MFAVASHLNLLIALLEERYADARSIFREGGDKFPNDAVDRVLSCLERVKAKAVQDALNQALGQTMRLDPDLPDDQRQMFLKGVVEVEQILQKLYEDHSL